MDYFRTIKSTILAGLLLTLNVSVAMATVEDVSTEQGFLDGTASVGFRVVNAEDRHRRAVEYTLLESSPVAGVEVRAFKDLQHFYLDAEYLSEADRLVEVDMDYKGLLRLSLFDELLYHNLDHIPYDRPPAGTSVPFTDHDAGDNYHVTVEQSGARLRAKLPDMPAHLNVSYWRLERSGKKQLRFVDENCASSCHMQSRTRDLDRVTEEVKAGVDAHLGPVDVIFEQLFRQFRDREPVPADFFNMHFRGRPAGSQVHDEDPDSRLVSSTLKAHTSLSGGVVGAASFTIGKRENQSELGRVVPVESETDFRKLAGDLTWIPAAAWTFNFRYRMLDQDNSNSSQVTLLYPSSTVTSDVRDNVDLTRASYQARVTYRPTRKLTLKGEFQHEEIHRGNTAAPADENGWDLPEDEDVNRYRISVISRPLGNAKLKLNGWYQYRTSDEPAYGNSAEHSHQGFVGATWTPSVHWGAMANLKLVKEDNSDHELYTPGGTFDLDRCNENQNLSAGVWLSPVESLLVGVNYGYLRSRTVQDLLFGTASGFTIEDENVEYSQRVHTLSLTASWRILEKLRAQLETRYIDSFVSYNPGFADSVPFAPPVVVDSSLLKDLLEVDIRQTGLSLGLDWSLNRDWTCSARYTFDDYWDRNSSAFDGSAQTYLASVSRSW